MRSVVLRSWLEFNRWDRKKGFYFLCDDASLKPHPCYSFAIIKLLLIRTFA